ncbi:MAG: CHAD domain-containing protein [Planctomycetes bacterium]|nr:CHAD domain-containing protein [Planctomycetota bacterium]MCW8134502.1 CHAD domain-containing protein [Planctomycetota bacterium]
MRTWLQGRRDVISGLVQALDVAHPDANTVHDLRVAVRRMRSVWRLWRKLLPVSAIRDACRALMRALNDLRDLDVLLERVAAAHDPRLQPALDVLAARRADLAPSAVSAVQAQHWPALEAAMTESLASTWPQKLSRPAPTVALSVIRLALREFRAALADAAAKPSPRRLHELRIAGKRLRYGLELHGGADAKGTLRRLQRFQDRLGDYLDARIAAATVRKLRAASDFDSTARAALGALVKSLAHEARTRADELPQVLASAEVIRWKTLKGKLAKGGRK